MMILNRKSYMLKYKRRIILSVEQLGNISQVARLNHIDRATVSKWVKNKTHILNMLINLINVNNRRLRFTTQEQKRLNCYNPEAEARLLTWFLSQREKKIGVSRLSILNKMLKDQE